MKGLIFSCLICTILTLTFSCQQPQPLNTEAGVAKSLAEYRKATINNVEYELAFSIPDSLETAIEGSVIISFDLKAVHQPVVLDFENPEHQLIAAINEEKIKIAIELANNHIICLLYTSPSPRDRTRSRMPSSA